MNAWKTTAWPPGWRLALALLLAWLGLVRGAGAESWSEGAVRPVLSLRVAAAIGPASADYVRRGLARAGREGAQLVVLQLDTPGGLDTSMRRIIQDVLASPVPVACFVTPQGARAASAGTYILYACHVAAMAPATHLGAATPVEIGMPGPGGGGPDRPPQGPLPRNPSAASGPGHAPPSGAPQDAMSAKRIGDAVAYIRGLAQLRGRNGDWAERAVREGVSLPAEEALAQRVIDLVVPDVAGLLRRLDGRTLRLQDGERTLATRGAPLLAQEPDWRDRLLAAISDPGIALVLMMLGVYGLLFEFASPGFVAPGVIGGICLLLALFGLQMLPVDYAGLGLILLGLACMAAEVFVPSFGVLGLGGAVAFAFGALMLVDSEVPGLGVPPALIAVLTLSSLAVMVGITSLAARARRRPQVSGLATLIGATGELIEADGPTGWALIGGERWRVRRPAGVPPGPQAPLRVGQKVRVLQVDGLLLDVTPIGADAPSPSPPLPPLPTSGASP